MSTNALVVSDLSGHLQGVSVHWDGYPSHLGRVLHTMCSEHFDSDPTAMAAYLIDEHPGGWSSLGGDPGNTAGAGDEPMPDDPEGREAYMTANRCYCHSKGSEDPGEPMDAAALSGPEMSFAEWTYRLKEEGLAVSQGSDVLAAPDIIVAWDEGQVDWGVVECGESYERCVHVCSAHFKVPAVSERLPIGVWLGREPMKPRYAAGYITRQKGTGRCSGRVRTNEDGLFEELIFHDKSREMVKVRDGQGQLLDGIQVLYPPTCLEEPGKLDGVLPEN